ncbi:hypothetical protein FGB62_22g353 [Gracilaria domingensis]|nr:hypothetical protein FGB62_22g353 [Gracilaria domingensis]
MKPAVAAQALHEELDTTHAAMVAHELRPSYNGITPEGTLLRVIPEQIPRVQKGPGFYQSENVQRIPTRSSATTYQGQMTPIPELAAVQLRHSMYPHRNTRVMALRPTTLGLFSVSALTSGSVLLRNATRKRKPRVSEPISEDREICSVVSINIPFCVSEREAMMGKLQQLEANANLLNPDGMACAAREAAKILLGEEGLLEDSRKFAPKVDVFLAENMKCAEKRFAGHVEIESHRGDRIQNCSQDAPMSARKYGVATIVVATTEGVDLACYNEEATIICRLRGALDRISRLRGGQVAGLELQWIPGGCGERSLTRAQLCEAFPGLKVV